MILAPGRALEARHGHLRRLLAEASVDALVVTHLPNVFYLTNFTGTAGIALLAADTVYFLTDFRYVSAIEALQSGESACPRLQLSVVAHSYDDALRDLLARVGGRRVGFEAAHLSVARHQWLATSLAAAGAGAELVPTQGIVEAVRVVKDASELSVLREAARRLSAVAEGVLADLTAGLVETEVALAIETGMRRAGFTRPAFDTIVASGPGSALPHARAGARRLVAGDLVVLDFGGVYNGYCVDLTRTVSMGPPAADAERLYWAVHRAQQAAVAAVAPGVATTAVDRAARSVLEDAGYGPNFGHGTGHGLGIEVHEAPRVTRPIPADSGRLSPPGHVPEPDVLQTGMVFTIEPGAYLPGFGGVRIEDDVVVTTEGCEVLTTVGRELRVC